MILVTGTGRSGTLSLVKQLQDCGLDAAHEPGPPQTMLAAAHWSAGGITDRAALEWLQAVRWAEDANGFWVYCTIMPLLDRMFPDAAWVWAVRNAEATVASMIARRWWLPAEDEGWPVLVTWPQDDQIVTSPPWRCRPNGYTLGDMSFAEWRGLPQEGRCAWWWGWVYRTMSRRPCLAYRVDSEQPDMLMDRLGLPVPSQVHVANTSPIPPVLPDSARPWIDRYCAEGMEHLYGM